MNRIITVGREFGSGGREVGRRLAEELQIAYYDHEIVLELVKRTNFSEDYIRQIEESRPVPLLPITIGRTISPQLMNTVMEQTQTVFADQSNIIREMAEKSDCVIVGRCADYILRKMQPFRLFVYADMPFKMARCRERAEPHERMTDKELRQHILAVDKKRLKYYEFYTGQTWGEKENFDLCINTTNMDIKKLVSSLAEMIGK